tara:strand:+ start:283 stop:543 length:261 start_codon:yes stop_codon:yes gene_type:complete
MVIVGLTIDVLTLAAVLFVGWASMTALRSYEAIIDESMDRVIRLQDDRLRKKFAKDAEEARNDTGSPGETPMGLIPGVPYRRYRGT